jgi:hypothetical protein
MKLRTKLIAGFSIIAVMLSDAGDGTKRIYNTDRLTKTSNRVRMPYSRPCGNEEGANMLPNVRRSLLVPELQEY